MNVAQIIAKMRRVVKVDTSQYDDDDALIDLNIVKDRFYSSILSNSKEKLNWERWKTSSVALQSEYTIPEVASDTAWAKLLNSVSINYNGETYTDTWELIYLQAKEIDPTTLPNDWDYYVENQSDENPIYYVADNSYFIAPVPRTAITNGIKLTGIRKIPDYTLSTTEAEMKLPIDHHNVLVEWLSIEWHREKWSEPWIVDNQEARYERELRKAIKMLETRVEWPTYFLYPSDQEDEITL